MANETRGWEYIYVIKGPKRGDVLVGRSAYILNNISNWPKGYDVQMITRVDDAIDVEKAILEQLKTCKTLVHRPGIDEYEYFNGHVGTVVSIVARTISLLQEYDARDDDIAENPLVSFMDMLSSK